MRVSVEYKVKVDSPLLAKTIRTALLPDLSNLPEGCIGNVACEENYVYLKIECSNISKLRALNNSFIGVLTLLLEIAGELRNE